MASALRLFKLLVLPACLAMAIDTASCAAASQAAPVPTGAIKEVTVIADATLDEPARHGVRKLEEALRAKGVTVSDGEGRVGESDLVLLMGLGQGPGAAAAALVEMKLPAPNGAEALAVRTSARYQGKPAILLTGFDGTGLMYAALDFADRISLNQ